jgi:hypothetical protein
VLASHVVEHIPDIISWFAQIAECLNPAGILSLIIPDKRFSFDRIRPLSSLAQVVGAYVDGANKPTSAQVFEHIAYHLNVDVATAWTDPDGQLDFPRVHSEPEAYQLAWNVRNSGSYFDVHCWVVTPSSMLDLIEGLCRIGQFPFEIAAFTDSQIHELDFFMTLRKQDDTISFEQRQQHQLASIENARKKVAVTSARP